MDNSGRREAPITFFFLIEFCFIQDILPQGSPDRKVNNIRKGFLVIHRLWMSLLVVSSGIFLYIHPLYFYRKPSFHSRIICG